MTSRHEAEEIVQFVVSLFPRWKSRTDAVALQHWVDEITARDAAMFRKAVTDSRNARRGDDAPIADVLERYEKLRVAASAGPGSATYDVLVPDKRDTFYSTAHRFTSEKDAVAFACSVPEHFQSRLRIVGRTPDRPGGFQLEVDGDRLVEPCGADPEAVGRLCRQDDEVERRVIEGLTGEQIDRATDLVLRAAGGRGFVNKYVDDIDKPPSTWQRPARVLIVFAATAASGNPQTFWQELSTASRRRRSNRTQESHA